MATRFKGRGSSPAKAAGAYGALGVDARLHQQQHSVFTTGFRIRIHLIRIRIQHFRLNTDPDPIRIQGFDDQKFKKIYMKIFFLFLDQKLRYNLPIPRPQ